MINPFPRARIYRALSVMLFMMVITIVMFFVLSAEQKVITDSVDTHATEDARTADLIKIARLARENQEMVSDIAVSFQSATDTVAVIESFELLGDMHNVALTINKAEKVTSESGETMLEMSAEITGDWSSVYRFVQSIDTFPYKHQTDRINFNKNVEDGVWVVIVEMSVSLTTQ